MDQPMTTNPLEPTLSPEPDESPVSLPEPMDIRSTLEAAHRATQEVFQKEIHRAGGPTLWITRNCALAFESVASNLTEAQRAEVVGSETQAFWVGLESRMRECASCPPEGAACVSSVHCFSPGVLVKLVVKGSQASSSLKRCDRYVDFAMARRLEKAGVDATLSMMKLSSLGQLNEEFSRRLEAFLDAGAGTLVPRKQQVLIEGPQARAHGVVLFRNVMRVYPNASYRSVHVPSLIRECKRCMTVKDPSPLDELLDVDVLVLDGLDAPSRDNTYFMPEITWVYERRRDQGLSTILTASVPMSKVILGAELVKVS